MGEEKSTADLLSVKLLSRELADGTPGVGGKMPGGDKHDSGKITAAMVLRGSGGPGNEACRAILPSHSGGSCRRPGGPLSARQEVEE